MPLPATGFKPPFKGSVNWSLSAHKSTTPAHGSGLADLLCEEKQAARRSKRMGLTHLPVYTDPSGLKKLVQKAEESDALGIHFHAVQGKEPIARSISPELKPLSSASQPRFLMTRRIPGACLATKLFSPGRKTSWPISVM